MIVMVLLSLCASLSGAAGAEPVNAICPIGKEPIVASAGTVEHRGAVVGLCCPGCARPFLAWSEPRRDEFVALARAGQEPGRAGSAAPGAAAGGAATGEMGEPEAGRGPARAEPYALEICPISGSKLGSMGEPVVKEYDGREVRFCCPPCIPKFEADLGASWRRVDAAMVKDQARYYPLETCVVSGRALAEEDKPAGVEIVHRNRLVRLCGNACGEEFRKMPAPLLAKLDRAAAEAQRRGYPLGTCIAAGSRLGSMGEPTEMVLAGRLLRFCCASCEPKVLAEPAKHLRLIDEAWRRAGRYTAEGR